jgi:hypothetical protein
MSMTLLKPFAPDIWIADGSEVETAGFRYGTRMAVIRFPDGALFVWSPVALSDALRADVDALGPVRFVVAPNALHHLFIGDWLAAWPDAKAYGAPGLRQKRPDVNFTCELGEATVDEWGGEVAHLVVPGNLITTEVIFFHRQSSTVLFTDLIQNFPSGWFKGWRGVVARLDLMTGAEPSVPRKFRLAFVDRRAARAAVARILAWPIERVLAAHAPPVSADGRGVVERAFKWLTG